MIPARIWAIHAIRVNSTRMQWIRLTLDFSVDPLDLWNTKCIPLNPLQIYPAGQGQLFRYSTLYSFLTTVLPKFGIEWFFVYSVLLPVIQKYFVLMGRVRKYGTDGNECEYRKEKRNIISIKKSWNHSTVS